ncbi:MAG: hypothetical protein GEU86_15440 [Actinophytocola sp.]|nr:hypothetical protein [Actinophytocola sp.]
MNQVTDALIIGAGPAGATAAATLRKAGYPGTITVVRGEDGPPYNRTTVNKSLLQGQLTVEAVTLPEADTPDVDWTTPDRAIALDTEQRVVTLTSGRSLHYRHLIITTGAQPRPFPGEAAEGTGARIVSLRGAADSDRLRTWLSAAESPTVTILGAGLIGSETAGVLTAAGAKVNLVSLSATPMSEHLGRNTGEWLAALHASQVDTYFGQTIDLLRFDERGRLLATLSSGESITSDVAVVSVGVTPAIGWLHGTALDIANGIAVDDRLRARGTAGVYAAGDLARITDDAGHGHRVEHFNDALSQGRHAALTLLHDIGAGDDPGRYDSLATYGTRLYGTKLTVVGHSPAVAREVVIAGDPDDERFTVALADAEDNLTGVIGVGDARVANSLKDAVRERRPLARALAGTPSAAR